MLKKLRVALGLSLLGNISEIKASRTSGLWSQDDDLTPPKTDFETLVKEGWRRNELIFACSSKKSRTASQVSIEVKANDGTVLKNHPLMKVFENPNPKMSQYDLWSSVLIFQDFAGAAYYEKVRSRAGRVVELCPMRPDWVFHRKGGGYLYGPPGKQNKRVPLDEDDVLAFSLFDPLDLYKGYPPVAVAARTGDIDNSVTDYVRLLFEEGGVPPGLLKTKQSITEAIATRARAIWKNQYGGFGNWLEPAVLGNDMEYQQTGLGIENMGIQMLDERDETRICMVMMVPPTVIGATIGLNRAIMSNAREFRRDWWMDDLIPLYKNLNDTIRNSLVSEFDGGIYTEWNFKEVPALSGLITEKREWALHAFESGALTRNEFYREAGFEELGDEGDYYLISSSQVEVMAGEATKSLEEPNKEAPTNTEDQANTEDLALDDEETTKFYHALRHILDAKGENPPDNDERLGIESQLYDASLNYLEEQYEEIDNRLVDAFAHRPDTETESE